MPIQTPIYFFSISYYIGIVMAELKLLYKTKQEAVIVPIFVVVEEGSIIYFTILLVIHQISKNTYIKKKMQYLRNKDSMWTVTATAVQIDKEARTRISLSRPFGLVCLLNQLDYSPSFLVIVESVVARWLAPPYFLTLYILYIFIIWTRVFYWELNHS